ncbi:helix-turn-helix transcriptional regulator [Tunicatimonas pelagia]|uniref:helix-turn-helix transcriptional regulator n=1 Tax=Tunicatimonas pelagia TaxID=931531 RepID=UPI002666BF07|nr:AraC family transcriptional regulator [Tunicatimonas pelagia]WKN43650.1 AraC family transcriptional regulator [Tunicatimonas pelagia]
MEILITDPDIHSVIKTIAKQLGTRQIRYFCEETTLVIPPQYGQGYIKGINFKDGLGLLLFNCTFNEQTSFRYSLDESHPLRVVFCQQGKMTYSFEPDQEKHEIPELHTAFCTSTETYDHLYEFPKKTHVQFTSLEINRRVYLNKIECDITTLPDDLANLLRDVNAIDPFSYESAYSIILADVISNIHTNDLKGLARKSLLESRSLDLFAHIVTQYVDDLNPQSKRVLLRKSDLALIVEAKNILVENIQENITIPELSRQVGINTTKLKQGFKKVFGYTINEFVRNHKLTLAKELLLGGNLSVKQIAEKVGYRNYAYFASRFKERYGALPSEYMKHVKHQVPIDEVIESPPEQV